MTSTATATREGAIVGANPTVSSPPLGTVSPDGPTRTEPHSPRAAGGPTTLSGPARPIAKPSSPTPGRTEYYLLVILGDSLDDIEATRMAAEARLRVLTSTESWGKGVSRLDPTVAVLERHLESLLTAEKAAVRNLQKAMRAHPLGTWQKGIPGVGEKQCARLLGKLGDPAWNHAEDRMRRGPAELWAYCGLDPRNGASRQHRKGHASNWSTECRALAWLIAKSTMLKGGGINSAGVMHPRSPYRDTYDERRAHTAVTHPDWSDAHSHNDALRITAKEILKDLYLEARRLHEA